MFTSKKPGFIPAIAAGCGGISLIMMLLALALFGFFGKDNPLIKPTGTIVAAAASGCVSPLLPKITDPNSLGTAIDTYIRSIAPRSPMIGTGKDFVQAGIQNGINPLWPVTIAQKESGFGMAGWAAEYANNAFGRTATDNQPHKVSPTGRKWYFYESFAKSAYGQSEYLKRKYIDDGLTTFREIVYVYAPPGENNTEQYIKDIENSMRKMVAAAGTSLDCGTSSTAGAAPPGADIKDCLDVREIPKTIPAKNNRLAHTTLVQKLEQLWEKNKTWRVTEACPATSQHSDRNHFNGRAIDIAINPPGTATRAQIDQLAADIKTIGFDDVLNEYYVNTTFKTGGHFHLEWHGD